MKELKKRYNELSEGAKADIGLCSKCGTWCFGDFAENEEWIADIGLCSKCGTWCFGDCEKEEES